MAFWRRRTARTLPDDAPVLFARTVPGWQQLDDDERARLTSHVERLLADKSWEAARGFTLTDSMCTVIAAQAALLALGFDDDVYREVRAVVVHRTTIVSRATRPGPVAGSLTDEPMYLHGEAHSQRGPMLLAWDAVRRDTRHPGNGLNVVIHEFAHKLDMLNGGMIDGTPPMPDQLRARWIEVCTAELAALRSRDDPDPVLRDYAANDPGEFFAVAAEVFFDRPAQLAASKPALYDVLRSYLAQDPAARVPPVATAVEGSTP